MSGIDVYTDTSFAFGTWSDTLIYTPPGESMPASVQVGGLAPTSVTLNGSVGQAGAPVIVTMEVGNTSIQQQLRAVCDIVGGGVFTDGAGDYFLFGDGPLTQGATYGAVSGFGDFADGSPQAACFAEGTRIETRNGPMPIEALRPGDQVRAVLRGARGAGWAPVIWMGRRRVVCSRYRRPEAVWPVRIAAGAFGPARPSRDLYLSPEHAILDGAALIPIRCLINDSTIAQVPTEQVTYWHIELASHDILLAEGLEAESYLDTGNRAAFDSEGGKTPAAAPDPDRVMRIWRERGCARLTLDPALHAPLRRKLHERALALGYRETDDAALLLSAGGAALAAEWDGTAAVATVPAGAAAIRLRSRSGVPCRRGGGSPDVRRLGVAVTALRVDGRDVRLDDMRLNLGWHQPEGGWRWTTGDAIVPLTRSARSRRIEVLTAPMLTYWQPPPTI